MDPLSLVASVVGVLSSVASLYQLSDNFQPKSVTEREQRNLLRVASVVERAGLILKMTQALDPSVLSEQDLRTMEIAVREILRVAERVMHDLNAKSKSKNFFLKISLGKQIEMDLEKLEDSLKLVEHFVGLLNLKATTRGGHAGLQEAIDGIHSDYDRASPVASVVYGLNPIYEPSEEALQKLSSASRHPGAFGIVFIHGLNATSASTWQGVDKYWPSDLLPLDFPQAYVMTYDYDSSLTPSSLLLSDSTNAEKSLVHSIVDWQRSQKSQLPLLFCAHSFGGILLKKAVAYCIRSRSVEKPAREFLAALKGIIFLGTPHQGSQITSYRSYLNRLAPSISRGILDAMTNSLESTIKYASEFRDFTEDQKLQVATFYESQPSVTPSGPIKIVVPERPLGKNDPFLLNGNHSSMCRFQTAQDDGYIKITKTISIFINMLRWDYASLQPLSKKSLEEMNLLKPLKVEDDGVTTSRTLVRAQQDYSEKSREFLLHLKQYIPVTTHSSDQLIGSCDWITTTDQFKAWRSNPSCLVILGHLGSGRSKYAEYVVKELNTTSVAQARTTNISRITLSHSCRWTLPAQEPSLIWLYEILFGLLDTNPSLFKEIYRKFDAPPLTYSDLEALVMRLIQTSSLQEIDIVVDGLDECEEESVRHICKTMTKLGLEDFPRIRILLTASSTNILSDILKSDYIKLILDTFPQHRNPQLMAFIENQLASSPNKHRYSNNFSIEIRNKLYSKASLLPGTSKLPEQKDLISRPGREESRSNFNWILAAIDVVEGELSFNSMKERLDTLPTTLDGLYDISLGRIPLPDREFVSKVLHFTRCSFRPLETKALAFALAVGSGHKTTSEVWDDQIIDLAGSIRPFCRDLLIFENGFVGFAHRSFSTYLDGTAVDTEVKEAVAPIRPLIPLSIGETHYEMAVSCIRSLLLDDDLETEVDQSQISRIPFIQYADEYWYKHSSAAKDVDRNLSKLVLSFIESSKMQGWLKRIRAAQPRLLLPEFGFSCHILASLDLLELVPTKQDQPSFKGLDVLKRIPMHYALANNASRSIKYLRRQGADIKVADTLDWSSLHFAIYSGNIELVWLYSDEEALAPSLLSLAITRRNWDVFELILERLDPAEQSHNDDDDSWTEWKDHLGQGLIHQAVLSRNLLVVKQLCKRNARIGLANKDGMTALHLAAKLAETTIVEFLIEMLYSGAEDVVDACDENGNTALHFATMSGDVEVIRLLAEHGANLNCYNKAGQLPLHLAAMYGYEKVVNLLLAIGSPVNTDDSNPSPLHLAAAWGWTAVAKRLVRAGATIESKDSKNRTPLYLAACNGSRNMVELLLSYGASSRVSDADGMTPLHVAALQGWEPVVSLLLSAGADVNATESKHGHSPLHSAAISKNPSDELVSHLLEFGADMEKPDEDGKTALVAARDVGNTLIAEFLLKAKSNLDLGKGTKFLSQEPRILLKTVDSFSSATRMDLLRRVEEREQRERQIVYEELL